MNSTSHPAWSAETISSTTLNWLATIYPCSASTFQIFNFTFFMSLTVYPIYINMWQLIWPVRRESNSCQTNSIFHSVWENAWKTGKKDKPKINYFKTEKHVTYLTITLILRIDSNKIPYKNKPMCAWVGAMTTVASN